MKRLVVFCEGPTEQGFCRQVLQRHLFPGSDGIIHTYAVGKKDNHHVYGIRSYEALRKFIRNSIRDQSQKDVRFTTLIDLYALPDDFPGKSSNRRNPSAPDAYATALEKAFGEDVDNHRFIPHLQLHEYETMLFSDLEAFRVSFENCDDGIAKLKFIAASLPSIEHIDDGQETAPSKRIIEAIPAYRRRKSSAGPDIAEFIGIAQIRKECPHFHDWLTRLENLAWGGA